MSDLQEQTQGPACSGSSSTSVVELQDTLQCFKNCVQYQRCQSKLNPANGDWRLRSPPLTPVVVRPQPAGDTFKPPPRQHRPFPTNHVIRNLNDLVQPNPCGSALHIPASGADLQRRIKDCARELKLSPHNLVADDASHRADEKPIVFVGDKNRSIQSRRLHGGSSSPSRRHHRRHHIRAWQTNLFARHNWPMEHRLPRLSTKA